MNMNNRCNSCGYNPCQCHTSCKTPVACIPPALSHRPASPTVSVEGLIDLINAKCDKRVCEILQIEISLLFVLLGLEHLRPDPITVINITNPVNPVPAGSTTPTVPVPVLPHKKQLQLVMNMVNNLNGDLTDKYASAELLKKELKTLWSCMNGKHQHHGEWANNNVVRDVQYSEGEQCILDGDPDSLPATVVITIPVDSGSTVFNTINGKRCLYESLVDDNTEEPTALTVAEGKWLNYCDIKEVIDCVLPKHILVDCHEACDAPNNNGVVEGKSMCERMEAVEAYMLAHP